MFVKPKKRVKRTTIFLANPTGEVRKAKQVGAKLEPAEREETVHF